ncbi:MAG: DUF5115 domain-containing protein [Muribaculaceae bacterium]
MKKIFLYVSILAASVAMVSCNEDYTDWADPQHNEQDAAQGAVSASVVAVSSEVKAETAGDVIDLVRYVDASNAVAGSTPKFTKIIVNETEELAFTQADNVAQVNKSDLDAAVRNFYQSQAYQSRELNLTVEVAVVQPDGTAIPQKVSAIKVNYLPAPLPASTKDSKFYYIGTSQGWDMSNCTPLEDNGDGTWSAIITVGDSDWFKFIPQSAVDAADWSGLYGCAENGSTASSDFVVYEGESMKVEKAGTYIFTLDVVNFTYSVIPAKAVYYIVGTPNGWSDSLKSTFYPTTVMKQSYTAYFTGAWDMKIWASADFGNWGNCIGTVKDGDDSESGSLITEGANSFESPEAGYYTLTVDFGTLTYTWTKLDNQEPTEYSRITISGDFNDWGDTDMIQVKDTNTHNWYLYDLVVEEKTELKFKGDASWDINWGCGADIATDYFGKGVQNGANITVPAGTYDVFFNDITGEFVIDKK